MRNTELTGSRLRSGAEHRAHIIAVGDDEERRGEERRGEEEQCADIKSNNPHLHRWGKNQPTGGPLILRTYKRIGSLGVDVFSSPSRVESLTSKATPTATRSCPAWCRGGRGVFGWVVWLEVIDSLRLVS